MAVSFVPFPVGEEERKEYMLEVEGVKIPLHEARVSAIPFNRRWPGHQRPIEQSELIAFASFTIDGPVDVTLTGENLLQQAVVRPLSKKVSAKLQGNKVSFHLDGPGFYTVDLGSCRQVVHLFAEEPRDYFVSQAAPDVLYFGPGVHRPGLIELKTNQTLYIAEGAVVHSRVYARHADHIRILGRGILDCSENKETILFEVEPANRDYAVDNAVRTHTVQLEYCKDVLIDGITIRDSQVYNIRPVCCEGLRIVDVKIVGNWRYNSDGIDMHNCYDIAIRHCFVRTFDDCICVKGFDYTQDEDALEVLSKRQSRFEQVLVEDCVLWCDWGIALEIGAETRAEEICNVTFQNCDVIHATHKALDIQNVDYADIHDIYYKDIRVECDGDNPTPALQTAEDQSYQDKPGDGYLPFLMSASVFYHAEYSADAIRRGQNHDIHFQNIQVTASQMPPSLFSGFDEQHKSRNITIEGLFLNGKAIKAWETANIQAGAFTENIQLK